MITSAMAVLPLLRQQTMALPIKPDKTAGLVSRFDELARVLANDLSNDIHSARRASSEAIEAWDNLKQELEGGLYETIDDQPRALDDFYYTFGILDDIFIGLCSPL